MPRVPSSNPQSGFTLLEMLVVLSIIAAVSGIGVIAIGDTSRTLQSDLVRAEMANVANAIRRFHKDTGYWPTQGPFAGTFHPADLVQLLQAPTDGTDPILAYDTASGTGWNGPYMRELDAVAVTVGDNLATDGTGSPIAGVDEKMAAIGDPFARDPDGAYFIWTNAANVEIARLGRPYLYFLDPLAEGPVTGCLVPCLVSLGPDGAYSAGQGDDIVVNISGI